MGSCGVRKVPIVFSVNTYGAQASLLCACKIRAGGVRDRRMLLLVGW